MVNATQLHESVENLANLQIQCIIPGHKKRKEKIKKKIWKGREKARSQPATKKLSTAERISKVTVLHSSAFLNDCGRGYIERTMRRFGWVEMFQLGVTHDCVTL